MFGKKGWKYFTEDEMKCKGSGTCEMDPQFMVKLDALRKKFGKPIIITSGYRSYEYNISIGGSKNSAHVQGKAADIAVSHADAYKIVGIAIELGFTGIGVSQKGSGRFIHVDTADNTTKQPRPHIWSY
jgi:uncharacterized protein YcbK (DUF882 family)